MNHLLAEAKRCLKCPRPRCSAHCPVATPIPQVIRLFEQGDSQAAAALLFANNPLSAITAIVCPHERTCAGHCVLGIKSPPIPFHQIERHLSLQFLQDYQPPPPPPTPYRVAIIGAGPAGLTASILLALRGFHVTLIDARNRIGGVLRYGIPEFRLPKAIIDQLGLLLRRLGVRFKPNTFVGSTMTLDDMFMDGYHAIFIAVGTAKPNKLGLLGETLGNVHYAIDYLKSPEAYDLGRHVVVVGAGNVALDAARMAVRALGPEGSVTLLNNRSEADMTANRAEIADAQREGVRFLHLLQAVRLQEDGVRCASVEARPSPSGTEYLEDFSRSVKIPADTIIVAIGQGPQGAVTAESVVSKTRHGLLDADKNGHTSVPGVFAAGDIVTGPKTVVDAVAFAKKVVEEIDRHCRQTVPPP